MPDANKNFWSRIPRPILALAPMVGVTDSAFRQVARRWGADVVYSEMISADAIVHKAPKALRMLQHVPSEYPMVVQLMGRNPAVMGEAAHVAEAAGASGIDINFGCPANKIARNFCGAMLMRDLDLSRSLIIAAIEAVSIPVSIKMRVSISAGKNVQAGSAKKVITIHDFLNHVSDLSISAIMVHGRSFEDPFDGRVDTEMIKGVKEIFHTGPVLANGGLTSIESARQFLDETAADGIGIARMAIGRPWIFKQVRQYLETEKYEELSWLQIKMALLEHVQIFDKYRDAIPFREIRKHLTHYVRGHEHASELRRTLVRADSALDVASVIQNS